MVSRLLSKEDATFGFELFDLFSACHIGNSLTVPISTLRELSLFRTENSHKYLKTLLFITAIALMR